MQKNPMSVACSSVLQQDRTVTVLDVLLSTVAGLGLTQQQEGLRRDEVGTVEKHARGLQHPTAGQNLHKYRHTCQITGYLRLNKGGKYSFRQ